MNLLVRWAKKIKNNNKAPFYENESYKLAQNEIEPYFWMTYFHPQTQKALFFESLISMSQHHLTTHIPVF